MARPTALQGVALLVVCLALMASPPSAAAKKNKRPPSPPPFPPGEVPPSPPQRLKPPKPPPRPPKKSPPPRPPPWPPGGVPPSPPPFIKPKLRPSPPPRPPRPPRPPPSPPSPRPPKATQKPKPRPPGYVPNKKVCRAATSNPIPAKFWDTTAKPAGLKSVNYVSCIVDWESTTKLSDADTFASDLARRAFLYLFDDRYDDVRCASLDSTQESAKGVPGCRIASDNRCRYDVGYDQCVLNEDQYALAIACPGSEADRFFTCRMKTSAAECVGDCVWRPTLVSALDSSAASCFLKSFVDTLKPTDNVNRKVEERYLLAPGTYDEHVEIPVRFTSRNEARVRPLYGNCDVSSAKLQSDRNFQRCSSYTSGSKCGADSACIWLEVPSQGSKLCYYRTSVDAAIWYKNQPDLLALSTTCTGASIALGGQNSRCNNAIVPGWNSRR